MRRQNVSTGSRWEPIAGYSRAVRIGEILPATTMIEVSRLTDPEMLVEIEAEALVGGSE